jgi:hypothetical protein
MLKNQDIINSTTNYLQSVGRWCLGSNNLEAISDVINDKYYFNDTDDSSKIKQIATEALHIGVKYTTWIALAEKTFYHITSTELGIAKKLPVTVTVPDLSTLFAFAPTVVGAVSLWYISVNALNDGYKGLKSLGKVVEKDYDGRISINVNELLDGIGNVSTVFPLFHCVVNYGLNGAILAVPLSYLSTHHELANGKPGKIVKAVIVLKTASTFPFASTLTTLAGHISNIVSKVLI